MDRAFIFLAYDGRHYCGWQTQPNGISVQKTIEDALATLLHRPTPIVGAGRTDAGVHARMMVAHFDSLLTPDDLPAFTIRLDGLLPRDIAIRSIKPVRPGSHARFAAVSRTYRYYVSFIKDPFLAPFSHRIRRPLNIDAMNDAAGILSEYDNFESFSKVKTDVRTFDCCISHAEWQVATDGTGLIFTITANRFLRNMVRAIVGTLFEIGWGKRRPDEMHRIIEGRNRNLAGSSAAANALFLEEITYPPDIFL